MIVCHAAPVYKHSFASVVSNTTVPAAGVNAVFCVVVMLGKRTPAVVLCTSRIVPVPGEAVPIPTLPEEKKLPVVVRAVNAPVFGVLFPIGGGEASKPEKKLVEPIRLTVKPLGADMMTSIYGNMKKKLVVLAATPVEV